MTEENRTPATDSRKSDQQPCGDRRTQADKATADRAEILEAADATADRVDASYEVLGRVELQNAIAKTQAEKFA